MEKIEKIPVFIDYRDGRRSASVTQAANDVRRTAYGMKSIEISSETGRRQ